MVRTAWNSMLLSVGGGGALVLDHWGGDGGALGGDGYLPHTPWNRPSQAHFLDGVPLAYSVYGDPAFKEPGLVVVRPDGSAVARLAFVEDRLEGDALRLVFEDAVSGLVVEHTFVVHPGHGVVVRDVRVENRGAEPLRVERIASAVLGLPPGRYEAWTLNGRWGDEYQLTRRELAPGKVVVDSRRGFTSHEANPWFALSQVGDDRSVWFGALAWSGNWSIVVESERNDAVHVVAGVNPFDSEWYLEPGESFRTPSLVCGYADDGVDGAARLMHRYQRDLVLPARHRATPPPVHYNTWLATSFDVEVGHQIRLAERAAELGVELFVVDDGWFVGRDDDHGGLGDWVVDPAKFPRGLGELVDAVHGLGMKFGIWLEPEMVNPDSDLFRAHPDWVLHLPDRETTLSRNQLVLNFGREEVREGVFGAVRELLSQHRIDFVKWDHNRPYTEVGWPQAPVERRREVWVRHVRGVYEVMGRVRAEFPDLMVETCAGGGGRVDLGVLGLADMAQVSDNTDPSDRLRMQYGFSRAYAPRAMVGWVADAPEPTTGRVSPLEFRFHVAMQGVVGISGDILGWGEEERARAARLIAEYKRVRATVQGGDQYWLVPPGSVSGEPCAVQYVSPDRGEVVVFVYQVRGVAGEGPRRIRLRGLVAERRYRRDGDGVVTTGAALMAVGVSSAFAPPVAPGHTEDWRSRVEVWRGVGSESEEVAR